MLVQKQDLVSLSPIRAGYEPQCCRVLFGSDRMAEQIHRRLTRKIEIEFYKIHWHENLQEQEMKREIKARTVMES